MNFKQKIAIFISLLLVIGMTYLAPKLVLNLSNSHSGTLFYKSNQQPKKGDFVYFKSPSDLLKNKTLSKQIFCVAGDYLVVDELSIRCNKKSKLISRFKKTQSEKKLPQFYFDGIIPIGMVFLYGQHQFSFDSRYYGLVLENNLVKISKIL